MNSRSNFKPSLVMLAAVSTLSLSLAACSDNGAVDARASEPARATSQPSSADPALDRLDGVTQHG